MVELFSIEKIRRQNKRAQDSLRAHEDRERDKVKLQRVFNGSGIHIDKPGDGTIYTDMQIRKFLNSLSERFPAAINRLSTMMGHSLYIWDEQCPHKFKYVEVRYPERGWYWKAPVRDLSGFDILAELNPLWFSIHPGVDNNFHVAVIPMKNPYMHRRHWEKADSIGNKNRWVNNQASRMLKSTMGYNLPRQRDDFIDDCRQFIRGE